MNMTFVKNVIAIMPITLLLFGSFFGCSSSSNNDAAGNTSSTAQNQVQSPYEGQSSGIGEIEVGEAVLITTEEGDLEVSVEGADGSSDWNERAKEEYSDEERIVLLKLNVKNISFEPKDGELRLSQYVDFADSDGFSIEPMSSGWEYGQYSVAVGGYLEISKGQKKKVVIPYIVDKSSDAGTITINGHYECDITIEISDDNSKATGDDAKNEKGNASKDEEQSNSATSKSSEKNDSSTSKTVDATPTTTKTSGVAAYCEKMQSCFHRLAEAMDEAHDAEAAGDVAAVTAAREKSDDIYYKEVLASTAPAEAKDVDYRMRQFAASANLLTMYYEDATIAKTEGDKQRYNEDMSEIKTVIDEVASDSTNLSEAINSLAKQYK